MTITAVESAGDLELDGTDVTAGQVVARTEIDAGKLIFAPAANAHGTGYATFKFKVNDGTAESAAEYTMTIDVDAENDAPAFAAVRAGAQPGGEHGCGRQRGGAGSAGRRRRCRDSLSYTLEGADAASFGFDASTRQITAKEGVVLRLRGAGQPTR